MSDGTGPALAGVLLVDLGIALGVAGVLALLHPTRRLLLPTRRRALAALALGGVAVLAGIALPAPEQQAPVIVSELDRFAPRWQFSEHHERVIRASPERVLRAAREVTAGEIRLFRVLTWIRRPRLPGGASENILAAPAEQPLLDVAQRSGFFLLAEEPGRELVIGSLVVVPDALRSLSPAEREQRRAAFSPEAYRTLVAPGYAKAAMNFAVRALGDGTSLLTTETRVEATDDATRRRFAAYWRLIYPGSSLIRVNWLAAIARRAEAAPDAAP